jgi:hypothetical protein
MSCITKLLELKGDKPCLPVNEDCVIEGGGIYENYEYLITFTNHGSRCGYVALKPKEVAIFEKERQKKQYDYPDIECHGGATFYSANHNAKNLLSTPCTDVWIGFDAFHSGDLPDMELAEKFFPNDKFVVHFKENPMPRAEGSRHRTYEYMENECRSIIDQLLELKA